MRKLLPLLLVLLLCDALWATTWNSQRSGLWSRTSDNADSPWNDGGAQAALATIPGNADTVTVVIAHVVTFDVDQSGFAAGLASLVVNGTLNWATDGTVTYLKMAGNITGTGSVYVGTVATPIPAPAGATPEVATIAFNGAYRFNTALANLELHGEQRVSDYAVASKSDNTHVVLVDGSTAGWLRAGDEIGISDSTIQGQHSPSSETFTVVSYTHDGTRGTIELGAALTRDVNQNGAVDRVVLLSHNILATNLGKAANTGFVSAKNNGVAVGVRFYNFGRGPLDSRSGWDVAYCSGQNNASGGIVYSGSGHTVINCVGQNNTNGGIAFYSSGYTITNCVGQNNTSGGIVYQGSGLHLVSCVGQNNIGGGIAYLGSGHTITNCSGQNSTNGGIAYLGSGHIITNCSGQNNTSGGLAYQGSGLRLVNCGVASSNNTGGDIYQTVDFLAFNCLFPNATEYLGYNTIRGVHSYSESIDHDQQLNAFKAWCMGGIVSSQTASPPTGYDRWYEHACESATYPCFRQYQTTVLAGGSIEVVGKIRIADGEDLSSNPPALQIIDVFADPLVDGTQTPLDECEIPDPDGSDTDWQDVSVVWANQGDSPRQVLVRMIAYHATADIDECWSVATYQDQIATLYDILMPLKTTVATSDTTTSFTLTAGEATADAYNGMTLMVQDKDDGHWELRSITDWTAGRVITVTEAFSFTPAVGDLAYIMGVAYGVPVDLTPITSKLPTGYIMGSSDQDNHDTDIDAILADTNELQTEWADGGRLDLLVDAIKAMTDLMSVNTTTIATVDANDPNERFTLTAGQDVNDAYWQMAIMVQDATDSHAEVRWIEEYITSRSVLVDEPFSFTPAPGDKAWILGPVYGGLLQQIVSGLNTSKSPIYYFKSGSSGSGPGGTTYLNESGEDP